jgi:hypothetical protein
MTQTTVSTIIAAMAVVISAFALYFLIVQIRLLRQQVEQARNEHATEQLVSKRRSTLEFLSTTLDARISFIKEIPSLRDAAAVTDYLQQVSDDVRAEKLLIAFLSCYEYISAGVNIQALDEETVHRTIGRTMMLADEVFKQYVEGRRQAEGHPSLYRELERTAKRFRACESRGRHPM